MDILQKISISYLQQMAPSTAADLKMLVPTGVDFNFEDLGCILQEDLTGLKDEFYPNDPVLRGKLQSAWARHPNKQGEKKSAIDITMNLDL